MSLSVQFQFMIHVLLYGIFIGVTLDFVCIVKEIFFNYYMQWAIIILYWLIQVPLTFVYIYNVNEGIFHLYILIFLIVGAIIYFKFLKQPSWSRNARRKFIHNCTLYKKSSEYLSNFTHYVYLQACFWYNNVVS